MTEHPLVQFGNELRRALRLFAESLLSAIADHPFRAWFLVAGVSLAAYFAEPYLIEAGLTRPPELETGAWTAVLLLGMWALTIYAIRQSHHRGARPR